MDEDQMQVREEEEEEEEPESATSSSVFSLKILPLTHQLHQKHGLRHNDYQRYRGYCSRRIARVRKATKMVQGEKKRFNKKEVTIESLKEEKHLEIPLMTVERAWAYAMQLKFEMNTEPRKRYHMINRMRKANKESEKLEAVVRSAGDKCDARAKLEAQAYHLWITGTLHFELQDWMAAMKALTAARAIYEKMASALSEEDAAVYRQRMNEIVPSLRFCAYNSGDEAAKQDLLNIRGQDVEDLLNQAREEQAVTLQDVEWRGRKMAVRAEKVRVFLLREKEFSEELAGKEDDDQARVEAYESLLMDCKDAIQAMRDDLNEDPDFRQRQQASEGTVSSPHFLHTYLCFLKCSRTVDRNLEMVERMKAALASGEHHQQQQGTIDSRAKPVKPQDLVRLFEAIITNLIELPQLAGLEEDLAFGQEIEAKVIFFKAWRCCFIAQAFLAAQKWPEAMALFQRATAYANKAQNDNMLDGEQTYF